MSIRVEKLVWTIGGARILDEVSFAIETGETVGLIGPNGSGKSSLLRLLAGLARPDQGAVLLGGRNIASLKRRAMATQVALVQQQVATDLQVSVMDVVRLGRTPYRAAFSGWSKRDEAAVQSALERVGMQEFARRMWHELSGGEKQRVHIAKAFAQEPSVLYLDEPTNHLDIEHQLEILKLVRAQTITSIIALHDLNHAAMFCDRVIVLQHGKLVAQGTPAVVLSEEMLHRVFRVNSVVETSAIHGKPHIQFFAN